MKKVNRILLIDALINLIMGILLLAFSGPIVNFLGVPDADISFYPNILGAVLFGIGIALLIECYRTNESISGLGLGGAIAINMCGTIVLAAWLLFGKLYVPHRGLIFLWTLMLLLAGISSIELFVHFKRDKNAGKSIKKYFR